MEYLRKKKFEGLTVSFNSMGWTVEFNPSMQICITEKQALYLIGAIKRAMQLSNMKYGLDIMDMDYEYAQSLIQ